MNRGYTRRHYLDKIFELKRLCPYISLSTDIIVGFPSETMDDFNDTLDLIREVEFDSIFAFAYSNRSSAPAAKFSGQVGEKEKLDRLNLLLQVQETFTEKKNKAQIGKTLEILVEGKSSKKHEGFVPVEENMEQMTGRSESNKIVHFPSSRCRIGDMVRIRIENAYPHSLWGYPELNG